MSLKRQNNVGKKEQPLDAFRFQKGRKPFENTRGFLVLKRGGLGTDDWVLLLWLGSVILVVNIIKFHRRMGFDEGEVWVDWINVFLSEGDGCKTQEIQ
jgi:hypothetical protein